MKRKWKEMTKKVLENMAEDMIEEAGCFLVWGEPELPECLKVEFEQEEEAE